MRQQLARMLSILSLKRDRLILLSVFVFGLGICLFCGQRGLMPLDQSIVWDYAWRLMNGQIPYRDFLAAGGLTPALIQVFFFKVVGINWFSYVLHAAFFNGLFGCVVYSLLSEFGLSTFQKFFYSIISVIFFYPPSGTAYYDHHSFFFGLLAIFLSIKAIKIEGKNSSAVIGCLVGLTTFFGILSKSVPSAYCGILAFAILLFYKKISVLKGLLFFGAASIVAAILVANLFKIDFSWAELSLWSWPLELARNRWLNMIRTYSNQPNLNEVSPLTMLSYTLQAGYNDFQLLAGRTFHSIINIGLVAFCISFLATIKHRFRPSKLDLASVLRPLIVLTFVYYTGVLYFMTSSNQIEGSFAFLPLLMAALHFTIIRPIHRSADLIFTPKLSKFLTGTLEGLIYLSVALDAAAFHENANLNRSYQDMNFSKETRLRSQDNPPGLEFLQWQLPQNNYTPTELKALVEFLKNQPENFLWLGDLSLVYALAGKTSTSFSLWPHPGLTMPKPNDGISQHYQSQYIKILNDQKVKFIVIEPGPWFNIDWSSYSDLWEYISQFNCQEKIEGPFRVMKRCNEKTN